MVIIISVIILLIFLVWLGGFIYANDFTVPTKRIPNIKKALLIFPHADDEALNSGGLVFELTLYGVDHVYELSSSFELVL